MLNHYKSVIKRLSDRCFVPNVDTYTEYEVGANVVAKLNDRTGILTLTGSGDTYDYAYGENPLAGSSDVLGIIIETGVTSIGSRVLGSLSNAEFIRIPESITDIGDVAFNGSGVSSLSIPSNVDTWGQYVFSYNYSLTECIFPVSMTSIPSYMFQDCPKLNSVILPVDLETIGSYAFRATGLTNITIPSLVGTLSSYSFYNARSLETIYYLYDGNATIGTGVFNNAGADVTGDKVAYCYSANTNFITAIESAGYTVTTLDVS